MDNLKKLKILHFNPDSIGKNPKRKKILGWLSKKRPDIFFVADTRFSPKVEVVVKREWSGSCRFASYKSNARGCAIFIKKDLPVEILDDLTYEDPSGNFLMIVIKYDNQTIPLCCIYGPNEDNPDFYKNVVFAKIAGNSFI